MVCYEGIPGDLLSLQRSEGKNGLFMTLRGVPLVATLATGIFIGAGTGATYAQSSESRGAGSKAAADPMQAVKASLKSRFGFTDAQATTVSKKGEAIMNTYKPRFAALRNKYGANPTPDQRAKMQRETVPLLTEIGKKMKAVLLSVATKEQRPKILAQMQPQQKK